MVAAGLVQVRLHWAYRQQSCHHVDIVRAEPVDLARLRVIVAVLAGEVDQVT